MASGFELTIYDLRYLSRTIAAEAEDIGARARDVHASCVTRTDFGHDGQDGVGAGYVRAVHDGLAEALRGVRSTCERFAGELEEVSRRYESAEENASARIGELERRSVAASGELPCS